MADSGNPEDLVSQVTVTGTEESLAKLEAYGEGGAKAFDKVNVAAAGAAAGVGTAAAKIDTAGKTAAGGFNAISQSANSTRDVPGKIKDIENAISNFTSKLPVLTQAVGRFSQRLALVGVAAVAAGVKLADSAVKVAKSVDGQNDSLQKNTQMQIDSNNAVLDADLANINYRSSVRGLNDQLNTGKVTYQQYNQSLVQLNKDYNEQRRVAAEVANAQDRIKRANDELTKSLKNREALQALIDTYGGPLTTALISFGRQIEGIKVQFTNAFGPGAADAIDLISNVLTRNAAAIGKFFDDAGKQINGLLKNNGPAIQALLENIGKAFASVFTGIINALPGVIDFFNNALVPAVSKLAAAFNGVAGAINSVFGTKLTGGSIVLIAIIAQITGSIRIMFALLRTGGAVFKGLISIVESIGVAIGEVFGIKAIGQVTKLGGAVAKSGGPIKSFLAIIRSALPLITSLGTVVASALGIGFGPAIIIIALVTAALIYLITQVDWKKFGAAALEAINGIITFFGKLLTGAKNIAIGVVDAFKAVNDFFNQLGTDIGTVFSTIWDGIVAAASATVAGVIGAWDAVVGFFSSLGASIGSAFGAVWDAIVAAVGIAVQAVTDAWNATAAGVTAAWNAVVAFFTGIPATLQSVWDTISNAITTAFQTAIDTVKGAFSALFASAKQFLQPILDLLTSIAALTGAAGGSGGSASTQGFAEGGAITGPGGPTSDTIPIWASPGEFMVKAASVAKYGVGFMRAINSGQFTVPKFAMGGLISSMINAGPRIGYADGGSIDGPASMQPLNLNLFGEVFQGLLAPEDVGVQLTKFAVARQNKSAGRKPAWVGRR